MSKIYTSVTELIGKTPLLELTNIEKELNLKAKIFAKLYPFLLAGIVSFILVNVLEILLVRGHNVNVRILYAPYILAALSFIAAT